MEHNLKPYESTKFPAYRRQASTKSQKNSNHPNSRQNPFGHLKLEFVAFLGFACR